VTLVYYIGDEATAAGYRLAGAETRVPSTADAAETFHRAVSDGASMILLSAEFAGALDPEELATALLAEQPLVAIVSDVYARHPTPDIAHEVRLALGIEP
jgi:vacuolar-type H+-ATPase subunit F/Vma7